LCVEAIINTYTCTDVFTVKTTKDQSGGNSCCTLPRFMAVMISVIEQTFP